MVSPGVRRRIKQRLDEVITTLDQMFDRDVSFEFCVTEDRPEGFPQYVRFDKDKTTVAKLYWNGEPMALEVLDRSFVDYAIRIKEQFKEKVIVKYIA